MRAATAALVVAACAASAPAAYGDYPSGFGDSPIVEGLDQAMAIDWAPDGRAFVAQKHGIVTVVQPNGTASTLLDIRDHVNTYVDRGLLGIAVDSDFANHPYLYLYYVYEANPLQPAGAKVARLTRVTVNPDNTASPETVLVGRYSLAPCPPANNSVDCIPADSPSHNGGTVRSAPDGTVWLSVGDANCCARVNPNSYRPYDVNSLAGKLIRVNRDGRGVAGHPFCPTDTDLSHVCTKLYAKGFRNPFRFTLRNGKRPVLGDVGELNQDEIDFVSAGKDYGWPCYEGTQRTPLYQNELTCKLEYAKPNAHTGPDWSYSHAGVGGAVIAGPEYTGSAYPVEFRGTIFVGDFVQGWIKRLEVNSADKVVAVHDFATGWGGVDLEPAPGNGDIAYAAFTSVNRIRYTAGNSPPTAKASASPTSGAVPLAVQFSGAGSSDPDGDALQYDWDFGDGSAHGSSSSVSHTYNAAGTYTAKLTVTDGRGGSDTDTVRIDAGNEPPAVSITSPASGDKYKDGTPVDLRASATDPQDGALPDSALKWRVRLNHAGTHFHEFQALTGSQTSFTPIRDHGADSHYEITLTATDSGGLTTSKTIEIWPKTVQIWLESKPAGAPLTFADRLYYAPVNFPEAVGFTPSISAASSFRSGGKTYFFCRWGDKGAQTHNVEVPDFDWGFTAFYGSPICLPG